MFKTKKTHEQIGIDAKDVKEQYIKVTFQNTGKNKTEVPGDMGIETQGLTDRHILMATMALLDTVYQRFAVHEQTLAEYLFDVFDQQDKQDQSKSELKVLKIEGGEKELKKLLEELEKRTKKDK